MGIGNINSHPRDILHSIGKINKGIIFPIKLYIQIGKINKGIGNIVMKMQMKMMMMMMVMMMMMMMTLVMLL